MTRLSPEELPRERLLKQGATTLDAVELLALVLGSGRSRPEDTLDLAEHVLTEVGGLDDLGQADLKTLLRIRGIGPVKATRIHAAFELCRRARPGQEAVDPLQTHYARLRGQIPSNERLILGYRPDDDSAPITLGLGETLGAQTRAGAVLARLLSAHADGAWWIVSGRPRGRVLKAERDAARRLADAASLLGMQLPTVLLFSGDEPVDLLGEAR
jgi:hypothetical protein